MIKPFSRFCKKSVLIFSLICGSAQIFVTFADGLPGEFLATQRWRYLFSDKSPLTNPAFINEENYISGRLAISSTLSEFNMFELGAVVPLGLYQSAALTWLAQGAKDYPATRADGSEIAGTTIKDHQNMFMLSYANNLWAGLTLGANVNILERSVVDTINGKEFGFGVDFGLSYRLLHNALIGDHVLGLSLQNLYTKYLSDTQDKYPRIFRATLNSTYWERRIESGFDFSIKDLGTSADEFKEVVNSALVPGSAKPEWDFNAKLGFWIMRFGKLYGILGLSDEGLEDLGVAVGLNMPSINNGRDVSFIYQFLTMPQSDARTNTIYLKGDIGKHREEIYARKMAHMANVAPNELYIKAVELYSQGNYWDAFFLFSELYVEFPDFFKNDWVTYFLGSCQENLKMSTTSEESYKLTKEKFARSTAVPFSDLGLMRLYYRSADYSKVEVQFNELNKLGVPDSIKYHGYYIMGEAQMKQGNQIKAQQLFDLIPDNHPDYVFAQHSAACAQAAADNIEGAVSHLESCVQAQVSTDAQKEIVNRSYVYLGYIFYEQLTKEEGSLAKAVTALRMVPKTSFYYPDAQLGLGWAALKAHQWPDCMNAGAELSAIAPNPVLKAEGSLLQAYSNMMQKNYPAAANLLQGASNDLNGFKLPSQDELSSKNQEYDQTLSQYTELARKSYDLGTTRQSSLVLKQIDSLHTYQKEFMNKINDHFVYMDKYDRTAFFARNVESVKEDVEYALAKAQKLSGSAASTKVQAKTQEKTQQIDKELQKLQEELKKQGGGTGDGTDGTGGGTGDESTGGGENSK